MRLKTSCKGIFAILLVLCVTVVFPTSAKAITPSAEEYTVSMKETFDVFIGNETPVSLSKGKEVYLVYTVESIDAKETTSYQHGIVASDNVSERYMYEDGGVMQYTNESGLLEEGSTYFLKFSVTDAGMECVAVRANGDDREVIDFPEMYGDATDTYQYVGIWFGCGNVTAELSHVLCYDENGNDLGVYSTVATVPPSAPFQYDTEIQQSYNLSADGTWNVAICNAKKTDAKVIYIEYTVESSDSRMYQTGVFSTMKPQQTYPHNSGSLLHDNFVDNVGNGYLLEPGASYIIRMIRGEKTFTAQVQRTIDGEHEFYSFTNTYGTYNADAPYAGLWFGEGPSYPITFELVNMKCYDANGNNLGIQCNQLAVGIEQIGEKTDYAGCESLYYSAEEDTFVALYSDKTAKVTKDGETKEVTYDIWDFTLYLNFEDRKETYEYAYQRFYTDTVAYNRLGTYYVSFETGTEETIEKQTIDQETGYTALKPQAPVREDATFEGWVLSDGTEYDFDSIVSESLTLYAKWSDGVVYENITNSGDMSMAPIIAIVSSVLLLVVAVGVSIVIVRRGGKKNVREKEKNNG